MPSANREVKTEKQFRCSLLPVYKLLVKIKGEMSDEHYKKLKETPFRPIFDAMLELTRLVSETYFEKTSAAVRKILNSFNSQTKKFVFGNNEFSFEVNDVVELLGLPNEGKDIPKSKAKGNRSALFGKLSRNRIETALLEKVITKSTNGKLKHGPSSLCSLLCAHLCCTFLLANSGGNMGWNLVKVFDKIKKISDYNWAKAVYETLMNSLTAKTVFPSGCTVALLYWIGKKLKNCTKLTVPGDNVPGFAILNLDQICTNIKNFNQAQFCEGGDSDADAEIMKKKLEVAEAAAQELKAEVENLRNKNGKLEELLEKTEAPLESPDVEEYDSDVVEVSQSRSPVGMSAKTRKTLSGDCVIIGVTHPPQNVDVSSKPATCTNKGRKRKEITPRQSLSAAGTTWESGSRRSTRIKMRPLEYWKGERLLYGRIHSSPATLIGVKYSSPSADGKNCSLNVKSYVSDEYRELVDQAALH